VQAYTLYSSVRPFGITAILSGWDTEAELGVDGQVGEGPAVGGGGKQEGEKVKRGGPGLYMIEPSGLYWVSRVSGRDEIVLTSFAGLLWGSYRQRTTSCQGRTRET
jgi:hypothetical protein